MLTLASWDPGFVAVAISGMVAVLVLIGGICWYAWHDQLRKQSYKLQKERETTFREMAAYVAEGSIAPDDAERLLRAMGETDGAFAGSGAASAGPASPGHAQRPSPRPSPA